MSIVKNLTKKEIEKVQIDEGVVIINFGKDTERPLAPCRGGGEFTASATIRDIEFDGRNGKTAGMQVIEEQMASLKVTTICMSQENLKLAMPFCTIEEDGTIKNPKTGIIKNDAYLDNVTMFAKLVDGTYKKITIFQGMHESGISSKAVQKAEGELSLEFNAHYTIGELDGDLWSIEEIGAFEMRKAVENTQTTEPETTENQTEVTEES